LGNLKGGGCLIVSAVIPRVAKATRRKPFAFFVGEAVSDMSERLSNINSAFPDGQARLTTRWRRPGVKRDLS
jgi:hypothetical protein